MSEDDGLRAAIEGAFPYEPISGARSKYLAKRAVEKAVRDWLNLSSAASWFSQALAIPPDSAVLEVLRRLVASVPTYSIVAGNAPGHDHKNPPLWDADNRDKAGTTCEWCAAFRAAQELVVATPQPETETR